MLLYSLCEGKRDEPIDLTEHCGRRHYGKFAMTRVRYSGEPWQDGVTVVVHVADEIPEDSVTFFTSHRIGNELESHATLEIESRQNKASH